MRHIARPTRMCSRARGRKNAGRGCVQAFRCRVAALFVCAAVAQAAVSGCAPAPRQVSITMTCKQYPQLLLRDGAVVCWDQPVGAGKAELYVASVAGARPVGLFRSPGQLNQPITATSFVSAVSEFAGGAHPDILVYDLTARTCEVLVRDAAIYPSPYSVSPDGRRLLVRPFQSGVGLQSIDLRNRQAKSLARNVTVWDAVWGRGGASVVYACTPHSDPKSIRVREVELASMQGKNVWSASLEAVSKPRCSPDGRNLAYITSDQLVCHSLKSGQRWAVARGRPADLDYVWSPDGSRLAVLATADSAELSVFDVVSRTIEKVPLDSGDGVVYPLGWLPDNKHFLVKIVDIRPHQHQIVAVTLLGKGNQAQRVR
jgi:hypothetical protein